MVKCGSSALLFLSVFVSRPRVLLQAGICSSVSKWAYPCLPIEEGIWDMEGMCLHSGVKDVCRSQWAFWHVFVKELCREVFAQSSDLAPQQRCSSALVLSLCPLLFPPAWHLAPAAQPGYGEMNPWGTQGLCHRVLCNRFVLHPESVRSKRRHRLRVSARRGKSWDCSQ